MKLRPRLPTPLPIRATLCSMPVRLAVILATASLGMLASAEPASADFRLCNKTKSRVGVALGYTAFRKHVDDWSKGRPTLAAWYEAFSKRPSMTSTEPKE